MRRIILALVFLTFPFFSSCDKQKAEPLRVGTNIWPGYEPLYLARELGYLDEEKVQLIEYPSASGVLKAFRNKAIEAATLTMDEVLLLHEDKQGPKIVLFMDFSFGGDVILGQKGIDSLKEVKGKKVGVESSALGAYLLTRGLQSVDMTVKDIDVVHLEVNKHENTFLQKSVDAIVTFEPTRSNLLKAGANLLFDSTSLPGEIVDVIIVRDGSQETHSENIRHMISAWFKALDYLKSNPDDAERIMAEREGVTKEQFRESLSGLRFTSHEENLDLLVSQKAKFVERISKLQKVMRENNILIAEQEPEDLILAKFLQGDGEVK